MNMNIATGWGCSFWGLVGCCRVCVCVGVGGVIVLCRCMCDLLIFLHEQITKPQYYYITNNTNNTRATPYREPAASCSAAACYELARELRVRVQRQSACKAQNAPRYDRRHATHR